MKASCFHSFSENQLNILKYTRTQQHCIFFLAKVFIESAAHIKCILKAYNTFIWKWIRHTVIRKDFYLYRFYGTMPNTYMGSSKDSYMLMSFDLVCVLLPGDVTWRSSIWCVHNHFIRNMAKGTYFLYVHYIMVQP